MPPAKDYTNMVFGQLKCLKRAESRNGKTYWLCECLNCGALKEVQTSHLTSGASKTCGSCNSKVLNFGKVEEEKKLYPLWEKFHLKQSHATILL